MKSSDSESVIEIRPSPIHGRGVFALSDFQAQDFISLFTGTPTEEDARHVLWVLDEATGQTQGWKGNGLLRFLNHSLEPNCEFRGRELYAIEDIALGEELKIHYGEDWKEVP